MTTQKLTKVTRKPSRVLVDFDESLKVALREPLFKDTRVLFDSKEELKILKKSSLKSRDSIESVILTKRNSISGISKDSNKSRDSDDGPMLIPASPPTQEFGAQQNIFKSINKYITSLSTKVPFESTSVLNLSTKIQVRMENKSKILFIDCHEYDTVMILKLKLEKMISIKASQLALFHPDGRRLESTEIVSLLNLTRNSILISSIQPKKTVKVRYIKDCKIHEDCSNDIISYKKYLVEVYSSETVSHLKFKISKKLNISPKSMEIRLYPNVANTSEFDVLEDSRDLFIYNIDSLTILLELVEIVKPMKKNKGDDDEDNEIDVENEDKKDYSSVFMQKEFNLDVPDSSTQITERFVAMTKHLNICECDEKRHEAIAQVMLQKNKSQNIKLLQGYTNNYHHIRCAQAQTNTRKNSSVSFFSEYNSFSSDEDSSMSLDMCIDAEVARVDKKQYVCLTVKDYEYLCKVTNFKSFKRFLRPKIGTTCSLRSVTYLYMTARGLVTYIGVEETSHDKVRLKETLIEYIILYFRKYFEKTIISKGGLGALTLSGSDIDE